MSLPQFSFRFAYTDPKKDVAVSREMHEGRVVEATITKVWAGGRAGRGKAEGKGEAERRGEERPEEGSEEKLSGGWARAPL